MKYADSFNATITMTEASQTKYSEWFDISWANELYSFATFAETGTADSESITITLQRFSPIVSTGTDIAGHSALAAAGSNEKVVTHDDSGFSVAYGTTNQLGMRVRWKSVSSAGAWGSGNVITMTLVMCAKRN